MTTVRLLLKVEGTVQAVGFRPFARNLAVSLGLDGSVGNDGQGAHIEVEGEEHRVHSFVQLLEENAPPLCHIEKVAALTLPVSGAKGFVIELSQAAGERRALVPPDTATCEQCLAELFNPGDRRYRYPFVNCTNCGPRFTIVRQVPYDRANTTMASFAMCPACKREYEAPDDRRFHAEPTCCPDCGPSVRLTGPDGDCWAGADEAIDAAACLLRQEKVLAIKGLGGYHLAALAGSGAATSALRSRKHRDDKPFAVMVRDLAMARQLCHLSPLEEELLSGPARPIVVARSRGLAGAGPMSVAPAVAPGNSRLGLMLPYTPVHHLLAAALGQPFVLTSGNMSDEPIAYEDADARARLGAIADAFLTHDRAVHMRTDDSVVRAVAGRHQVLRRSRGLVPTPIALPRPASLPTLACGAELKNTFCLAKGGRAFISHHIGDLENYEALKSYRTGIEHFCRLFDIRPQVVAHDLHPEYLSTKYALARDGVHLVGVQHHHAHLASCLVDNGCPGPVIGIAFDGLGYGDDGGLWGGEVMVATLARYERLGHLDEVPMPGGVAAIKHPWRMAVSYLEKAFAGAVPPGLAVVQRHHGQWDSVAAVATKPLLSPATSSMGRLFDAVGSVVCGRDSINYEGQAAVELEQLAQRASPAQPLAYRLPVAGDTGPILLDGVSLVRHVAEDLLAGALAPVVAARFHRAIADAVARTCRLARERCGGLASVALSGGVFQNALLTEWTATALAADGFTVLAHRDVPPNDGGISLGQAAVACAQRS